MSKWNESTGMIELAYSVQSDPLASSYPLVVDFYTTNSNDTEPFEYLGTTSYTVALAGLVHNVTLDPEPGVAVAGGTRIVGVASDQQGNSSEQSTFVTLPEPGTALAVALGSLTLALLAGRTRMDPVRRPRGVA